MSRKKSTRFKLLEGNPGCYPLPREPLPRPVVGGKSPYKLGHFGLKFYRDISKRLSKLGILTELDRYTLELLARSYQTIRECDTILQREGLSVADKRGSIKKNPLCSVRKDATATFIKLSEKFGLSPYDRHGFHIEDDSDGDDDLLSKPSNHYR